MPLISAIVRTAIHALRQPYRVPPSMIVMLAIVPVYIFIPAFITTTTLHRPEIALDRVIPLEPAWALVYGSLYLSLIVLPIFVIRDYDHLRRTMYAYLFVWLTAYVSFMIYPTVAPRPAGEIVPGAGFAVWGLQRLYDSDPPFNCFPSIHVGHSFVSALTCYRLHHGVGAAATVVAGLVALSTLFTKQHYVLDAAAGMLLAAVAYALFLRAQRPDCGAERRTPAMAAAALTLGLFAVAASWIAYRL